jgi:M-phase inducer tyrosine phosphatase
MSDFSSQGFDVLLIVDARFDYEWEGGHIKGSYNARSIADLKDLFQEYRDCNACVVFHCEFSKERGPSMMKAFRQHDRCVNNDRYPEVNFPSLFLLEGGYRQFYHECPDLCEGGYVPMREERFVRSGALRRSFSEYMEGQKGAGHSRAATGPTIVDQALLILPPAIPEGGE